MKRMCVFPEKRRQEAQMRKSKFLKYSIGISLGFVAVNGVAADLAPGSIETIATQYEELSSSFYNAITGLALKLLFGLMMIEIAWFGIKGVLERKSFEDLLSSLVATIFPPLLFVTLIKFGNTWLPAIIDSFWKFAEVGAGIERLEPTKVMLMGIQLQNSMVSQFNQATGADSSVIAAIGNFFPAMMLTFVCLVILISFALMALNYFLVQVEAFIIIAVSPMLMAFGGWRWTRDMGVKSMNAMIGVGVKIVVLTLVLKIAITLAPIWAQSASAWRIDDWTPLWLVAFSSVGMAMLAWKAPQMASSILSGTSSLSAGDALQIAATAAAATVGAAAFGAGAVGKASNTALDALEKGTSGLPNLGKELGQSLNGLGSFGGNNTGMDSANVPDPLGPPPEGSVDKSLVPELPNGDKEKSKLSSASEDAKTSASDQKQTSKSDKPVSDSNPSSREGKQERGGNQGNNDSTNAPNQSNSTVHSNGDSTAASMSGDLSSGQTIEEMFQNYTSRIKGGLDELGHKATGDHADVGGDLIKVKE